MNAILLLLAIAILLVNACLAVAGPGQASANTIDYMGVGVGNAPPNYFGLQDSVFGQDVGIGDGESPPKVTVIVGTAFATSTGATLTVLLVAGIALYMLNRLEKRLIYHL